MGWLDVTYFQDGHNKYNRCTIVFTKYAIRINNNEIRLSLSKEMQNKFQVEV